MDRILTPLKNPYESKPKDHTKIWNLYKKHVESFWVPETLFFEQDLSDWRKLNSDEKYFIKHILAFFAGADILVGNNINKMFTQEVQLYSSRCFYGFQSHMENIHNETYRKMLDCYVENPIERTTLENGSQNIPCIKKKIKWAEKWMNDSRPFAERIIAFICVEGVHFCSSFAGIFWLKERGLMKWLTHSNEYISRDEHLHVLHGIFLYESLDNKLPVEKIHEIFREAVELEVEFSSDAIPCRLIGLNADLMEQYIKYLANQYLMHLGVDILYPENLHNPFSWMKFINVKNSKNFFEAESADYRIIPPEKEEDVWN